MSKLEAFRTTTFPLYLCTFIKWESYKGFKELLHIICKMTFSFTLYKLLYICIYTFWEYQNHIIFICYTLVKNFLKIHNLLP